MRRLKPRSAKSLSPMMHLEKEVLLKRSKSSLSGEAQWIHTIQADMIFALALLAYALLAGVEVELGNRDPQGEQRGMRLGLACVEILLSLVFLVEFVLRVRADGLRYICRPTGIFDAILICTAAAGCGLKLSTSGRDVGLVGAIRVLRLLRLCQITRILSVFPELRLVSKGLLHTIFSVTFALVPLVMMIYIGALFCADTLGRSAACTGRRLADDPHDAVLAAREVAALEEARDCAVNFFGSVPLSLFTNTKLALLEGWPDIADVMLASSSWWCAYLAVFLAIANMVILNTVAQVICGELQKLVGRQGARSWQQQQDFMASQKERFEQLFDKGCRGRTTGNYLLEDAYLRLITAPRTQPLLQDLGVGLPLSQHEAVAVLDLEDSGYLTKQDWVAGVMRLRDTRGDCSTMSLQAELSGFDRQVLAQAESAELAVKSVMKGSVTKAGWSVLHQLKALEQELETLWLERSWEDVASEQCIPEVVVSPKVVKASMYDSPCSTPRSDSSELPLPPLRSMPIVGGAGAGFRMPEQQALTEADIEECLTELEASSHLFRHTVSTCSWTPRALRKQRARADATTQTEDDSPVGANDDSAAKPLESGLPLSDEAADDSVVRQLLFADGSPLAEAGAGGPLKERADPAPLASSRAGGAGGSLSAPQSRPAESLGQPLAVADPGAPSRPHTNDSSQGHAEKASPSSPDAGEDLLQALNDASTPSAERSGDRGTPRPQELGTPGLQTDDGGSQPGPASGTPHAATPAAPATSPQGWASDPKAAQRRKELLDSMRGRARRIPSAASPVPLAMPISSEPPVSTVGIEREELAGGAGSSAAKASSGAAVGSGRRELEPMALSRRLRSINVAGASPSPPGQR